MRTMLSSVIWMRKEEGHNREGKAYICKKESRERGHLKRGKLNIRIHNPNTEEETVRFVTRIFVDVGVQKLEQEVKKEIQDTKNI